MTSLRTEEACSTSQPLSQVEPKIILMGVPSAGATGGGPALHLPMLVEDLRRDARYDVHTFAFGRWGEGETLPVKIWHQIIDLLRFPALLWRVHPAVVHLNSSLDRVALLRDFCFTLLARLLRKPVFIKWHGSEVRLLRSRSPLDRLLLHGLFRSVAAIGVLSTEELKAVRETKMPPPCFVVRNGLDLERYRTRCNLHERFGLRSETKLFLFIARLIPAKGLLDVIRALPQVLQAHDAHLVVVGDGPLLEPAKELVRNLQLQSAVHFTGRIPEEKALDFYCGCDVLVFPTYHIEGFPMTVFQSVAAGIGIVTSRIRAAADYLVEPDNCVFVRTRDVGNIAEGMRRLLDQPELLAAMRKNNRLLAERFERQKVAAEFRRIYDVLLSPPGERTGAALQCS